MLLASYTPKAYFRWGQAGVLFALSNVASCRFQVVNGGTHLQILTECIEWLPMQFEGGEMNLDPWFSISLCLDCRRMLLGFAWWRGARQANPRLRLRFQVGFWSSFFDSIPCQSNNLARGQEKRRLVRVVALLMGRGKLGNQQPPLAPPQQSAPGTWVIGMPISKWNRSHRLS